MPADANREQALANSDGIIRYAPFAPRRPPMPPPRARLFPAASWRRTLHLARRVRQLDGIANCEIRAARRMIDLDDRAGRAQRGLLGDLLHREDRSDRDVNRIAFVHDLELAHGHGPFLDRREDVLE